MTGMNQKRANTRGYVLRVVNENAPPQMIASHIVEALNQGVTYEQMARDTGWPVEKLKALRETYPETQSAMTYTPK